jgi:predicted amidohydrolase
VGIHLFFSTVQQQVDAGVPPGNDCPAFETRFDKVGMVVCYDGFFPEVAREPANRGAAVIAWPVCGCNSLLAGPVHARITFVTDDAVQ